MCSFSGPVNSYSVPVDYALVPEVPDAFSFLVFECRFYGSMPFRMQGDCPVIVTALLQSARQGNGDSEGG